MNSSRLRTAVLVSGRGSNMRALAEAARQPGFPAEIALVLADAPDVEGLSVAASLGLATAAVDRRDHGSRDAFERALEARLEQHRIAFVCLAGFMRLLSGALVERWAGRMINIHPSLLPSFRGLDTHERALAAGVRIHGCTVHYVVPEVDAGPIIAQAAVPVLSHDTPSALAARVLVQEHRLYPHALRLVASGAAPLDRGRVDLRADTSARTSLAVPDLPT